MKYYKRIYSEDSKMSKEFAIYKSEPYDHNMRRFYRHDNGVWIYVFESTYNPSTLKPITKKQAFLEIL